MKLKHHTALLAIALATAIAVSAVYFYMYYSVSRSIARAQTAREIVRQEEWNKTQEEKLAHLYQLTRIERVNARALLVNSSRVVDFIEAIENIGDAFGSQINISSIDADKMEKVAAGTLGNVMANVDVKGNWTAVMKTLVASEMLPYKVAIRNVRLSTTLPSKEVGEKHEWHLSFEIEVATIKN